MAVKPIPEGYHTVTPYLIVENAAGLIDFATQVLGAQEMMRMPAADGRIGHAEIKIGDSVVMLSDPMPESEPQRATLLVYVDDCDSVYRKALTVGATSEREPADQFYGDRSAGVNAGGISWWFHTHVEDVSPEEMEKRMAAMQPAS
jgi:PhnB protein